MASLDSLLEALGQKKEKKKKEKRKEENEKDLEKLGSRNFENGRNETSKTPNFPRSGREKGHSFHPILKLGARWQSPIGQNPGEGNSFSGTVLSALDKFVERFNEISFLFCFS